MLVARVRTNTLTLARVPCNDSARMCQGEVSNADAIKGSHAGVSHEQAVMMAMCIVHSVVACFVPQLLLSILHPIVLAYGKYFSKSSAHRLRPPSVPYPCPQCRRQIGAIYTADVAVQATLLASIPILAVMLPGDALNCVYSGAVLAHRAAIASLNSSPILQHEASAWRHRGTSIVIIDCP